MTMRSFHWALCTTALLAGCVSYSGYGLVAGTATAADVEAKMGKPAEVLSQPDGSRVLYYPRGPGGLDSFAVLLGADGKLQAIEQRLTDENLAKIVAGTTTAPQVRALLGPSTTKSRMPRQARDVWEYRMGDNATPYLLWVQFSNDGIVREVIKLPELNGASGAGSAGMN
jgi:hypothetical protein